MKYATRNLLHSIKIICKYWGPYWLTVGGERILIDKSTDYEPKGLILEYFTIKIYVNVIFPYKDINSLVRPPKKWI